MLEDLNEYEQELLRTQKENEKKRAEIMNQAEKETAKAAKAAKSVVSNGSRPTPLLLERPIAVNKPGKQPEFSAAQPSSRPLFKDEVEEEEEEDDDEEENSDEDDDEVNGASRRKKIEKERENQTLKEEEAKGVGFGKQWTTRSVHPSPGNISIPTLGHGIGIGRPVERPMVRMIHTPPSPAPIISVPPPLASSSASASSSRNKNATATMVKNDNHLRQTMPATSSAAAASAAASSSSRILDGSNQNQRSFRNPAGSSRGLGIVQEDSGRLTLTDDQTLARQELKMRAQRHRILLAGGSITGQDPVIPSFAGKVNFAFGASASGGEGEISGYDDDEDSDADYDGSPKRGSYREDDKVGRNDNGKIQQQQQEKSSHSHKITKPPPVTVNEFRRFGQFSQKANVVMKRYSEKPVAPPPIQKNDDYF